MKVKRAARHFLCGGIALLCVLPLWAAEVPKSVRAVPFSSLATYPEGSAPAQVISLNDSLIEADVAATVVRIESRVGDVVEAGAALLSLECDDQRNTLQQQMAVRDALKARLAFAEFQYGRAQSLVKSKNISDEQLRQRQADAGALKAELSGAEAGVAQALKSVARCTVHAPFKAVVLERLIGAGEKAQPGKPLLRLLDLSAIEVSAQVAASDAPALTQVAALALLVDGKSYPLRLRSMVPALEPRSRSREVRLYFTAHTLPPGTSGRLTWRQPTPHIPAEYLLRRDGRYGVFVVDGETARFVELEGVREGSPAATNLPAATLIVTEGRFGLVQGEVVSVVEK